MTDACGGDKCRSWRCSTGEEDHCLDGSSAQFPVCSYPMMETRPRAWDSPHLGPMKRTCSVVCSQHIEKSCTQISMCVCRPQYSVASATLGKTQSLRWILTSLDMPLLSQLSSLPTLPLFRKHMLGGVYEALS